MFIHHGKTWSEDGRSGLGESTCSTYGRVNWIGLRILKKSIFGLFQPIKNGGFCQYKGSACRCFGEGIRQQDQIRSQRGFQPSTLMRVFGNHLYPWRIYVCHINGLPWPPSTKPPVMLASIYHTYMDPSWDMALFRAVKPCNWWFADAPGRSWQFCHDPVRQSSGFS